ncbi:MAG: hypothetical protein GWO02_01655 [Gammaproteobacteria bacterium]|nr:hypothetical protein [Gammaproteobacteria bacterium]
MPTSAAARMLPAVSGVSDGVSSSAERSWAPPGLRRLVLEALEHAEAALACERPQAALQLRLARARDRLGRSHVHRASAARAPVGSLDDAETLVATLAAANAVEALAHHLLQVSLQISKHRRRPASEQAQAHPPSAQA